jgi:hypothetical protein
VVAVPPIFVDEVEVEEVFDLLVVEAVPTIFLVGVGVGVAFLVGLGVALAVGFAGTSIIKVS